MSRPAIARTSRREVQLHPLPELDPMADRIERMYKMLEKHLGRSLTPEEKRLVTLADRYYLSADEDESDSEQSKAAGQ